jgi:hypothetical protein
MRTGVMVAALAIATAGVSLLRDRVIVRDATHVTVWSL